MSWISFRRAQFAKLSGVDLKTDAATAGTADGGGSAPSIPEEIVLASQRFVILVSLFQRQPATQLLSLAVRRIDAITSIAITRYTRG